MNAQHPPFRRRRGVRLFAGALLIAFNIPILAWLLGILVAITCGGFAGSYDTSSWGISCWIAPGSTVVRGSDIGMMGLGRRVQIGWSSGSGIVLGRTYVERPTPGMLGVEITHATSVPVLVLAGTLLVLLTRRCLRRPRAAGQCPSCGYSSAGLPTGTCPECGKAASAPGHR